MAWERRCNSISVQPAKTWNAGNGRKLVVQAFRCGENDSTNHKWIQSGHRVEADNSELLAGEVKRKVRLLDYKSVCGVEDWVGR